MPVVFGLCFAEGGVEIVVIEGGIENGVTSVLKVGRLDAADNAVPTVEEKDFHDECVGVLIFLVTVDTWEAFGFSAATAILCFAGGDHQQLQRWVWIEV